MAHFPTGAANTRSVEDWLSTVTERLQELMGAEGAQAVLSKALADAKKSCPSLYAVVLNQDGLDLSALSTSSSRESTQRGSQRDALNALIRSLYQLLTNLLGEQLTSQIAPSIAIEGIKCAAGSSPSVSELHGESA